MRVMCSAALCIVSVVGAASAAPWAPSTKAAKAQIDAAAALYERGDYATAADGFEAANRIEASNRAIWNAAQSHGAAGNWPRALVLLDQLLADPELPKSHLAHVVARRKLAVAFVEAARLVREERVEDARSAYDAIASDPTIDAIDRAQASRALAEIEALREPTRSAGDDDKPLAPIARADDGTAVALAPASHDQPAPTVQRRGRDVLGWTLVGTGLVAVGAGGVVWWSATQFYDNGRAEPEQTRAEAFFDKGDARRIAGQVVIGAGAVVLAVGVTKLVLRSRQGAPSVALTPTARGGGALVLAGEF